jgi:acetyl/propionyl-CoA carboxylase alpha subunit
MADRTLALRDGAGRQYGVIVHGTGTLTVEGTDTHVIPAADGSVVVCGPERRTAWAAVTGGICWVFVDGEVFTFEVDHPVRRRAQRAAAQGPIEAPMPATVHRIAAAAGDQVRRGDVLLVLEAMKMELPVRAPADGRVAAVSCREGEMVQAGQELVRLD